MQLLLSKPPLDAVFSLLFIYSFCLCMHSCMGTVRAITERDAPNPIVCLPATPLILWMDQAGCHRQPWPRQEDSGCPGSRAKVLLFKTVIIAND